MAGSGRSPGAPPPPPRATKPSQSPHPNRRMTSSPTRRSMYATLLIALMALATIKWIRERCQGRQLRHFKQQTTGNAYHPT